MLRTTTGKPKELDSVMLGIHYTISELVRDIILHYKPPPAKVVDPMCGNGVFYKAWDPKQLGYEAYFSDIEKTEFAEYVHDVRDLKKYYVDKADVIILDPSYPIAEAGNWSEKKNLMRRYAKGQIKNRIDFEKFIKVLNSLFREKIVDNGILIAKVQDVHREKTFIPYHILLKEWLENFELHDIVIYRNFYNRAPWPSRYAHNTHSYFLIFKPHVDMKISSFGVD